MWGAPSWDRAIPLPIADMPAFSTGYTSEMTRRFTGCAPDEGSAAVMPRAMVMALIESAVGGRGLADHPAEVGRRRASAQLARAEKPRKS